MHYSVDLLIKRNESVDEKMAQFTSFDGVESQSFKQKLEIVLTKTETKDNLKNNNKKLFFKKYITKVNDKYIIKDKYKHECLDLIKDGYQLNSYDEKGDLKLVEDVNIKNSKDLFYTYHLKNQLSFVFRFKNEWYCIAPPKEQISKIEKLFYNNKENKEIILYQNYEGELFGNLPDEILKEINNNKHNFVYSEKLSINMYLKYQEKILNAIDDEILKLPFKSDDKLRKKYGNEKGGYIYRNQELIKHLIVLFQKDLISRNIFKNIDIVYELGKKKYLQYLRYSWSIPEYYILGNKKPKNIKSGSIKNDYNKAKIYYRMKMKYKKKGYALFRFDVEN